jgi:hypothetical protein
MLFGAEDREVRGFRLTSAAPLASSAVEAPDSAIFRGFFEDLFDCMKIF